MYLVGVPLLLVPFAIYNIFAFVLQMGAPSWDAPIVHVALHSGADLAITPGTLLIAFTILLLLIELVKMTRLGLRNWVDHLLAVLLFAGMVAEFVMLPIAATSTFFLLVVASFVDVTGGIVSALSARARRRELMVQQVPLPVRGKTYAPPPVPVRVEPEPSPVARRFEPSVEPRPEPKPELKAEPKPEPNIEPPVIEPNSTSNETKPA